MTSTITTKSFRGVWKRTELFEPRGTLGPEDERQKIVLWVQSSSGIFIDIRVCQSLESNSDPLNVKSFAGVGEYDESLKHFTWTRCMDFRPPGAPDVGLMNFTSPDVVEEDGVLPGDDFKEIWTQQLQSTEADPNDDFVSVVRTASGKRKGYFLVVGDYFAFALSRDGFVNYDKMSSYFNGEVDLESDEKSTIMSYTCLLGRTSDWKVSYSLNQTFLGCSMLPGESKISELLGTLQWGVVDGTLPQALSQHVACGGNFVPRPYGRCFKGIPVPFYFQQQSAVMFGSMPTREDDVFLSSLPKGGTTWTNKIVSIMTTGKYDDDGNTREDHASYLGGTMIQVYPESLMSERSGDPESGTSNIHDKLCFEDIVQQPSPRLFSTHLFGSYLPQQLTDPHGHGRLIIVLRNLKDTATSLHFFRGEAKDGWLGNEHGPGSFFRFIDPTGPNAYGSCFDWITENDKLFHTLRDSGRAHIIYFEDLKQDLAGQLQKLHNFLGLGTLTPEKCEAIMNEVNFKQMKSGGGFMNTLLRKGEIGDWKNYLDTETWSTLDEIFEERLGDVVIASPLRQYH